MLIQQLLERLRIASAELRGSGSLVQARGGIGSDAHPDLVRDALGKGAVERVAACGLNAMRQRDQESALRQVFELWSLAFHRGRSRRHRGDLCGGRGDLP